MATRQASGSSTTSRGTGFSDVVTAASASRTPSSISKKPPPPPPAPKSFVKSAPPPGPPAAAPPPYTPGNNPASAAASAAVVKKGPPPPPPLKPKPKAAEPPKQFVKALYDFAAQADGDLDFRVGDTIEIVERSTSSEDWWTGKLNGRQGVFPGSVPHSCSVSLG
jgi:amphiphysin